MTEEIEAPPDDILRALEVERARPPASAEQLARLAERLDATFAAMPAAAASSGGAVSSAGSTGVASSGVASSGIVAAGVGGKVALLVVGLVLGGLGGSQLQARYGTPREVTVERILREAPTTKVEAPVQEVVPDVEAPAAKVPTAVRVSPAKEVPKVLPAIRAPIELERLWVEQATSALNRGQGADALAACSEHLRQFPHGQLSEERESLAIRALVSLGRKEEAAARAASFRTSYPESLLLDVVNSAVR